MSLWLAPTQTGHSCRGGGGGGGMREGHGCHDVRSEGSEQGRRQQQCRGARGARGVGWGNRNPISGGIAIRSGTSKQGGERQGGQRGVLGAPGDMPRWQPVL
jgi:hypothetical protein